jgi:hypothetical protein
VEWRKKIEKAETLWQSVRSEPEWTNTWGFYSYGDVPGAIGGGFGSFAWFETRYELLSFIRDVLPYSPPGRSDADWEKVEREVHELAQQAIEDKIDLYIAVDRSNDALKTFSQIEWIGAFDDLICGNDPFAEQVRKELRELEESDSSGR